MVSNRREINISLLLILLLAFLFLGSTNVFADSGEKEKVWSFDFNNCTVSDALSRIAKATGKKIDVDGGSTRRLSRIYKSQTVGEIIKDILQKENHIISIFTARGGKDSIKIWLPGSGNSPRRSSASLTRPRAAPARLGLGSPPMPPGPPMPGR
jgi:hypothetical protein